MLALLLLLLLLLWLLLLLVWLLLAPTVADAPLDTVLAGGGPDVAVVVPMVAATSLRSPLATALGWTRAPFPLLLLLLLLALMRSLTRCRKVVLSMYSCRDFDALYNPTSKCLAKLYSLSFRFANAGLHCSSNTAICWITTRLGSTSLVGSACHVPAVAAGAPPPPPPPVPAPVLFCTTDDVVVPGAEPTLPLILD